MLCQTPVDWFRSCSVPVGIIAAPPWEQLQWPIDTNGWMSRNPWPVPFRTVTEKSSAGPPGVSTGCPPSPETAAVTAPPAAAGGAVLGGALAAGALAGDETAPLPALALVPVPVLVLELTAGPGAAVEEQAASTRSTATVDAVARTAERRWGMEVPSRGVLVHGERAYAARTRRPGRHGSASVSRACPEPAHLFDGFRPL